MTEEKIPIKKLHNHEVSVDIPTTAKAIKITNIQSLYTMRAYEIGEHENKIDRIYRQLMKFINTDNFSKKSNSDLPVINDMVLVQSSNHKTGISELPSYLCRGVITYIKENMKYNVFLVDHGVSIELIREEFDIVPKDFISEKYLMKTVGVHNICPVRMKISNGCNSTAIVVEEWSEEANQFAKDLFIASEVVYFNHLVTDEENGREYGEFYLIIKDTIMPLSEALVINYYATYLEGGIHIQHLLQHIENSNYTQCKEKDEIIIRNKFSINENRRKAILANEVNKPISIKMSEKVLIQSNTSCGVVNDVGNLGFPKGIHMNWNEHIKSWRPKKLQSYIWPAITKGLNVVAIGPSQCGKTTGCVMALCGLIAMHSNELSRSATHPLALILCPSSFEVINIQSLCATFLQTFHNIKSVAAFNGKTYRSLAATIYGGCQILIATPRYLLRFLKENRNILSFDKLSYLFFDDADVILDKYSKSLGKLFKKHNIIDNREPHGDNRPILQIIISAKSWTSDIKTFVPKAMYDPYICITSFIEAVVFKSVHPKLHIVKSTYKTQMISDCILKENDYTTLRTMIVCTNANEAEKLNMFLRTTKETLLMHENMKAFDIQALNEIWKVCVHGFYPVLICTDQILSQSNFTNIQWLIHYSVTLTFMNQFNYRFSVLLDSLIEDSKKCKINIIIDENNDKQFQSIVKLMQRMNVKISKEMLNNIDRIAVTLEENKKNYDICDNVKSVGFCLDQSICAFRHCILPKIDVPITDIQINDQVKLMVTYVHDATHFSARLIEYISHSNNSKKIPFSNVEYMEITLKIQEYYRNIENRKVCTSTNVGDICVVEESVDTFKRVQIRRIRYDRDVSENVKFVDVRCIDTGIIHECIDIRKLIHIPKELLNLPTHIVDIFLSDIEPCDEEYIWNHYTNEAVHKWFSKHLDKRSYVIGKVRLYLGNTIWLDDLQIGTKLIGHNDLIGSSLKKELITENHAVLNDNHISYLLELCRKSGLLEINGLNITK